jgi:hypothetical protein
LKVGDYISLYQKRSAIFTSTLNFLNNLTRDVKYFSGHICQTTFLAEKQYGYS